ncbi:hypothetical protein LJR130_005072 [Variovorax sp. LjRoot130]|uniref:hypothetical protein n=1 Tax=Variovorax sp. LjRoot130 TaxID=3342261 RepID=UPI003ECDED4B
MSIRSFVRLCAATAVVAVLAGCAHPIVVSAEKTPERVESQLVQKKVAYAMTDADRAKEVTTEGGGGDRVSYYPYRDLEKAIREALRSVYADVIVIRSAADANAMRDSGVALVFTPEIKTTSGSPSPFTWPPTRFTSEIACKVTDASGQEVASVRAAGSGNAEFSEFKSNFSLAANRAGSDVASKLSAEIRANDKLR